MSDHDLRGLERAARARPDDPAAWERWRRACERGWSALDAILALERRMLCAHDRVARLTRRHDELSDEHEADYDRLDRAAHLLTRQGQILASLRVRFDRFTRSTDTAPEGANTGEWAASWHQRRRRWHRRYSTRQAADLVDLHAAGGSPARMTQYRWGPNGLEPGSDLPASSVTCQECGAGPGVPGGHPLAPGWIATHDVTGAHWHCPEHSSDLVNCAVHLWGHRVTEQCPVCVDVAAREPGSLRYAGCVVCSTTTQRPPGSGWVSSQDGLLWFCPKHAGEDYLHDA